MGVAVAAIRDPESGALTVVSGSSDKSVKAWDGASGARTRTRRGTGAACRRRAPASGALTVVSGSVDKSVKVWHGARARGGARGRRALRRRDPRPGGGARRRGGSVDGVKCGTARRARARTLEGTGA